MENAMTQTRFWTILGTFLTIIVVIFGYVISEINATENNLNNYQYETFNKIADINDKTARIEVNVEWIKEEIKKNFK